MRLVSAAMLAGPVTLVLLSPWLAARLFDGRAPARTVATFHLLALTGMALLPLVVLPCLALVRPADLAALASPNIIRVAQTVSHALAVAYLLRIAWVAVRLVRATSRLASMSVLAAAEPLAASGGVAGYVLASPRPVAFAVGGRSRGVVVSRGLLGLLDDDERDAVVAHELAHLLLGHHRLLLVARIIRAALGTVVPPVGDTYASLARELEVLADQAAAGAVGDRRVVARALAKAALATTESPAPAPTVAFGGACDLAYRLDRLTSDGPCEDRRGVAAAGIGLLAAGLLAIVAFTLQPAGLVAAVTVGGGTVVGIGWLSWRGVAASAPTRMRTG
jgi:Zn-dependent protease with chaperone function